MAKKKLKFKRRRHLDVERLFRKKADEQLFRMDWSLRQAFPDPVKRAEYIEALMEGLEDEPTSEQIK